MTASSAASHDTSHQAISTHPAAMHSSSTADNPHSSTLPLDRDANMTLDELTRALHQGLVPVVEVMSLDGIYKVRIHHCHGISDLTRNDHSAFWFKGTGEIRDLMGARGISHGVLTWTDQRGDEIIGVESCSLNQEELLAWGTRICFR